MGQVFPGGGSGGGGGAPAKYSLDHSFADGMGPFTEGAAADFHIVSGELHPNVAPHNDMAIWIQSIRIREL